MDSNAAVIAGLVALVCVAAFLGSLVMAVARKSAVWIVSTVAIAILGTTSGFAALAYVGFVDYMERQDATRVMSTLDGTLEFAVPGHWTVIPQLHDQASLEVGNALHEEYLIVIQDSKIDFVGDLDAFTETVQQGIVDSIQEAQVMPLATSTINGIPARQVEIRGVFDNLRIVYLVTTLEGAASFHQVLTWSVHSRWERARPVFDDVLATARAIPGPVSMVESISHRQ